jgi:hypothetical protein
MKEIIDNLLKLQTLALTKPADAQPGAEKLRAQIPAPVLAHYDRLVARGKKGVAAVRNQICTGCHMQVPLGVTITLMHGDDLQICESCGRYLYLAVLAPADAPKPAKRVKKIPGAKRRKAELLAA